MFNITTLWKKNSVQSRLMPEVERLRLFILIATLVYEFYLMSTCCSRSYRRWWRSSSNSNSSIVWWLRHLGYWCSCHQQLAHYQAINVNKTRNWCRTALVHSIIQSTNNSIAIGVQARGLGELQAAAPMSRAKPLFFSCKR